MKPSPWSDTGRLGPGLVNVSCGVLGLILIVYLSSVYGIAVPPRVVRLAEIAGVVFVAACVLRLWGWRVLGFVLRSTIDIGRVARLETENAALRRMLAARQPSTGETIVLYQEAQ